MTSRPDDQMRIVVTGMGAVTNVGVDAKTTWESLRSGRSGITALEGPWYDGDPARWSVHCAGQVKGWDPAEAGACEKRDVRRLDRNTLLGLGAATEAVTDSGIDFNAENSERCGVAIGSGIGGISTIEEGKDVLERKGPSRISPYTVPRLMVNATAGNLSIRYGLQGPSTAHATACASSGHAIAEAMEHLRHGRADVMLAGGCEAAVTPLCIGAFMTMKALSGRSGDPSGASRPFDQGRDGFVLSEGAAFFVLETLEHAKARGAQIYGELLSSGNSSDAGHITAPDPSGLGAARSMSLALDAAQLNASDIDYVNAHGTSTPLGDKAEVAAVMRVFGDHAKASAGGKLIMSSTKSMTGHCLGASGAVELIACLQAVKTGVVPPTINLDDPDEEFDIDLAANDPRERPIKYAMNNTFGFGGHNVTLMVGRYE